MEVHQVAVRTIAAILAALLASAAAALALDDGFLPVLLASSSAAASGPAYEFPTNGLCVRFELSAATGTNNLAEPTNNLSIVAGRGTTIIEGIGLTTTNATGNCASFGETALNKTPETTEKLTISAWVKWLALADRDTLLYGGQVIIRQSGTNGALNFYLYGGPTLLTVSNACQLNTWANYTFVEDGTNQMLYINGSLAGSLATAGKNIIASGTSPKIGSDGTTDTAQFSLGSLAIWSVAMSPTEITNLYVGTKGSK